MNNYHWEIPRKGNESWSALYQKAQEIAERYSSEINIIEQPIIKDFSITQNSLEQVFLRLTKLGANVTDEIDPQDSGQILSVP